MPQRKPKAGRPRVGPETGSVTIAIPRDELTLAESMVTDFDRASALGVRHTRIDVLRYAISRGLQSLKAEAESLRSRESHT